MILALQSPAHAGVVDRPYFNAPSMVIVFGASDFQENGGVAPIASDFSLLDTASGTAGTDLISGNVFSTNFNTGRINPIQGGSNSGWEFEVLDPVTGGTFISAGPHQTLDANDAYTAFEVDADTDVDLLGASGRASRFFVASNAAFDIYAQASNLQATGGFASLDYENIRYRLRVQPTGGNASIWRWGANAQDPSAGGAGVVIGATGGPLATLDDIDGVDTKVFDGGQRTASAPGSILSQAVAFQSRYNLRGAGINGNNYDFSMGAGSVSADITYTIYTP